MASVSDRIKTLHDSIAAYAASRLLIVPAHAQQIADDIAVLAADVKKLEAMLERRMERKPMLNPKTTTIEIIPTISAADPLHAASAKPAALIDLASHRNRNKKD